MDNIYYQKYLKYKSKYLELQKLSGGDKLSEEDTKKMNRIKNLIDEFEKSKNSENKEKKHIFANAISEFKKNKKLEIPTRSIIKTNIPYETFRYQIYCFAISNIMIDIDKYNIIKHLTIEDIDKIIDLHEKNKNKILSLSISQIKNLIETEVNDFNTIINLDQKYFNKINHLTIKSILELIKITDFFDKLKDLKPEDDTKFKNLGLIDIKKLLELTEDNIKKLFRLLSNQIIKIVTLDKSLIEKILTFENIQIREILLLESTDIQKLLNLEETHIKNLLSTYEKTSKKSGGRSGTKSETKIFLSFNHIKKILNLEEIQFKKIIDLKPKYIKRISEFENINYILNIDILKEFVVSNDFEATDQNKEKIKDIIEFRVKDEKNFDDIYNKIKENIPPLETSRIFNILHKIRKIANIRFEKPELKTKFYKNFITYFIPNLDKINLDDIFNTLGLESSIKKEIKKYMPVKDKSSIDTSSTSTK